MDANLLMTMTTAARIRSEVDYGMLGKRVIGRPRVGVVLLRDTE